jgi:hypothetical protein
MRKRSSGPPPIYFNDRYLNDKDSLFLLLITSFHPNFNA